MKISLKIATLIITQIAVFSSFNPVFAASQTFINRIGIKFIYIEPGRFMMGSPESETGREWDEKQHTVILKKGIYISQTEITQGQWTKLMGKNPSSFKDCGSDCPVETVSWYDCQEFINKLNQLEQTDSYRLPTEAEWEYAARAGSNNSFCFGDIQNKNCEYSQALDMVAWYCGNSGKADQTAIYDLRSHEVATKNPNAWGLYDMHGNVQEWCIDSCEWRKWTGQTGVITKTYKNNMIDPLSKDGENRIFRGGSWNSKIERLRSASRSSYKPVAKKNNLGFRLVKQ